MMSYHLLMSFASELAGAASLRNGCFRSSFAVARWFRFRTNALPRKSSSNSEACEEDMDRLRKQVSTLHPLCFVVILMLLHLQHTNTHLTPIPHPHPNTHTLHTYLLWMLESWRIEVPYKAHGFQRSAIEVRRFPVHHLYYHDAQWPDVNLGRIEGRAEMEVG